MSAALKKPIGHTWFYGTGPVRRNRFFWREGRCTGCGLVDWHRADEPAPQDTRCSINAAEHEHAWADEHIRELVMDGRQTVWAAQRCMGCSAQRTVKRFRVPAPVGDKSGGRGGKHG